MTRRKILLSRLANKSAKLKWKKMRIISHTIITLGIIRFLHIWVFVHLCLTLRKNSEFVHLRKIYFCKRLPVELLNASKSHFTEEPFQYLFFFSFFFWNYDFLDEPFQTSYYRHHAQLQFSITRNLVLLFSAPSLSVTDDGVWWQMYERGMRSAEWSEAPAGINLVSVPFCSTGH